MQIRMLVTQRGSEDGVRVQTYEAGLVYQLEPTTRGQELGEVFLREKWAELVRVDSPPPPPPAVPPEAPAPALEAAIATSEEPAEPQRSMAQTFTKHRRR